MYIHVYIKQFKGRKQITQLKMGKKPDETLLKRRYVRSEWVYQTMFHTLTIREMQVETARYHLILVWVTIIKKKKEDTCL